MLEDIVTDGVAGAGVWSVVGEGVRTTGEGLGDNAGVGETGC